ncbi:hypothetical protein AURDEDRAFT_115145 [Auricularia subglabra TFB-10046 SS5]|nr:hypothetical protein AURDEDRAFT_115145 [Auricularia subglabra TFB-10046 SS5]
MGLISALQNFFFPKVPLVPPKFDENGWRVGFAGGRRHKTLKMTPEEFVVRCIYSVSNPFTGKGRASQSSPPLHWHRQQAEEFTVLDGTLGYLVDDVEHYAKKGETITLHPGHIHTFWADPRDPNDLMIDIALRPGVGLDEDWIHSLYGYFDSAYESGKGLSFLQLMVFWDQADGVPGTKPKFIGRFLVWFFGRWVGRLAGYKGTYDIYARAEPPAPAVRRDAPLKKVANGHANGSAH